MLGRCLRGRSVALAVATQIRCVSTPFAALDTFARRHTGDNKEEVAEMLRVVGVKTLDDLIDRTVPGNIRMKKELSLPAARSETETLADMRALAEQNTVLTQMIGLGYYETVTPPVILRNIIENPCWYTPYTPYQAEIAQGRMESLVNFQTMVANLTGMQVANASLLDEGTAASEAMNLAYNHLKGKRNTLFVDKYVFKQTLTVVQTRAAPFGINVVVGDHRTAELGPDVFGVMVQYPGSDGRVEDLTDFAARAKANGSLVLVGSDLLALTKLKPPGEWGADVCFGNSQRFGVPLGYGGPHAAFFAVREEFARKMPGRIIGVTRDAEGRPAYRLTLQTREQHIRREKATSNICTAQALLSNVAAMYGVYHGPDGLRAIADRVHRLARAFAAGATAAGFRVSNAGYFDTVRVDTGDAEKTDGIVARALEHGINIRKVCKNSIAVAFCETATERHVDCLLAALDGSVVQMGRAALAFGSGMPDAVPEGLARTSSYMTHPVFNSYHTEHGILRYMHKLVTKDIGLQHSMIPLGSCTMKLNATAEMIPLTWPQFGSLHPFAPKSQATGYAAVFQELEAALCEVTGFDACSLQPNSGAAGEYAGLYAIRGYHYARGDKHRNVCLIPESAHGTNPASAAMAGMKVVVVKNDEQGNIVMSDLKAKAEQYKKDLAALMVTYPSTYGVFEESIKDMCEIIHAAGGQVYMDGANMNAQVGLCRPGDIGADVCHLNLHKTFCIPHGGGGPGMGPIACKRHLAPYLPSHPLEAPAAGGIGPVASAPYSSASILTISLAYIKLMGAAGLRAATCRAILNANYMQARMKGHYNVLFRGASGFVAHEYIVDVRPLKATADIDPTDIAKRLQDYGFHAPTMSWPVAGTLMIEPTESETKAELDRFCDAMISIRNEIREIESGKADRKNNLLKNAPHTARVVTSDKWDRPYSRERAAFPLPWLHGAKPWPTVSRVDDVYGDRNLFCSCPPPSEYGGN